LNIENFTTGTGTLIVAFVFLLIGLGGSYFANNPRILYVGALGITVFVFYCTHLLIRSLQPTPTQPTESPFVFVIGMGMSFGHSVGTLLDNGVSIPTVTGQPMVYVTIQAIDQSAFDIDAAGGFLVADKLPPERPPTNERDLATPGVPLPSQHTGMLRFVCPFTISKQQEVSIAHKQEFFILYGWVKYRAKESHETGFAGIWNVSTSSFDLPKQNGYNYQK
jgi:hypothetical protein